MKSGGAPPFIVVIGGVDPSGGAGLIRDVRTAAALGMAAHAVGTAWTEQADGIHRVEARQPAALEDAVRYAVSRSPAAIKTGMVPDARSMEALLAGLGGYAGPLVVDPVLASSRGGALWQGAPADLFPLLRRATVVTPNALEAAALAGLPVQAGAEAEAAAGALRRGGLAAVLVKGGHLDPDAETVTDLLATGDGSRRFTRPRVPGASPRGTGCALATAIAVHLARGAPVEAAIADATTWLAQAIATAGDAGGERHLP